MAGGHGAALNINYITCADGGIVYLFPDRRRASTSAVLPGNRSGQLDGLPAFDRAHQILESKSGHVAFHNAFQATGPQDALKHGFPRHPDQT